MSRHVILRPALALLLEAFEHDGYLDVGVATAPCSGPVPSGAPQRAARSARRSSR